MSRYERFSLVIERAREGGYIILDYEIANDLRRPIFAGDTTQVIDYLAERIEMAETDAEAQAKARR